ncbi:unnamed protein product [Calypogeia fissa]
MALDGLGRLGCFNCGNCISVGQIIATSPSSRKKNLHFQSLDRSRSGDINSSRSGCFHPRPAGFATTTSSSRVETKFTSNSVQVASTGPFRDGRLCVGICRKPFSETCSRVRSLPRDSATTRNFSSNGRLCSGMVNGRFAVLDGWIGGSLGGVYRSSSLYDDFTRSSFEISCPACRYSLHQIVCYAQASNSLGSFLGTQVVEEPWSYESDAFNSKARQARRSNGGSSSPDVDLSRGLRRARGVHGVSSIARLQRTDAAQLQPLTSARPRRGTNYDGSPLRHIVRNCIPQSHDTPPKRDTGIASEKDWGINLKNELITESGINEDGSTWYRESGEDFGDNGYRCRWTVMGGQNADGTSEWKEAWWEKSDWTGYKELGAEKSGRNAQGDTWWETWQEVLRQDDWSNLARIELSAQKQAKSGSGSAGWYEKWWEKYNAKGWSEKGAHKYGRLNDQGWWEKWGEQYDGRGAVLKWTDKWAETDMGTKWGDKWEENFNSGIGTRQGETWHYSANGERWSRTWGEEHTGTGKVHKYGKSTSGESWDSVVEEGTFYQAEPHYGWADAVGNSVQLLSIEALERPPGIYPDLDLGMNQPPQ